MAGTRTRRAIRDQVIDLETAIEELRRAKVEISALPETMRKRERENQLVEPMARLALVRRFIAGLLAANGWKEIDADD